MHLVSYIGLIRLINQSHPQTRPSGFAWAIFMKWVTGKKRSSKFTDN